MRFEMERMLSRNHIEELILVQVVTFNLILTGLFDFFWVIEMLFDRFILIARTLLNKTYLIKRPMSVWRN